MSNNKKLPKDKYKDIFEKLLALAEEAKNNMSEEELLKWWNEGWRSHSPDYLIKNIK